MRSLNWPQAIGIIVAITVCLLLDINLKRLVFWALLFVGLGMVVYCPFQVYKIRTSVRNQLRRRNGGSPHSFLESESEVVQNPNRSVEELNAELVRWWVGLSILGLVLIVLSVSVLSGFILVYE